MFVKSHPSKDITLEGVLKLHRLVWQAVADLTSRAIGGGPRIPLNFLGKRGFMSAWKNCEGVCKSGIAHECETEKLWAIKRLCSVIGERVSSFTHTRCKLLVLQCCYSTHSKANILFSICRI